MTKFQTRKNLYSLLALTFILISVPTSAQREFFKSRQHNTHENLESLENFNSSISLANDLILFNANDFNVYAYDKNSGDLVWRYPSRYKSNIPIHVEDTIAYVATFLDNTEQTAKINTKNGKLIKNLPFGPLATKPIVRKNVLYGTAIYDYGCIVAYDLKTDTVIWSRFLAHGFSRQPYFFKDKIVANAEGDNWVEINYNGSLLDTTCKKKANIYVENIPCIKQFRALTHDRLEIKGKLALKIFGGYFEDGYELAYGPHTTLITREGNLYIFGDKLRQKRTINISAIANLPPSNEPAKIIKVTPDFIWLLFENHLIQYYYNQNKIGKNVNLTQWQPSTCIIELDRLWLVSKNDGLLYGLLI
jgi:hypothetical protein